MATVPGPSASDIVYLFGDRFASKPRLGGETLLYGGNKVKLDELANTLVVAALADLASKGYVGLEVAEEKKLGLFTSRDVQVSRLAAPGETLYGLEEAIWGTLTGDPKKDRVRPVIARILGGERPNPWRILTDLTTAGLAQQGYFSVEKEELRFRPDKHHWSANEELILPHEGRVDQVKAMLSSLETRDSALYKQLLESVKKGIKAMVEHPDYDTD
jgi:hypothetical protein